MHSVEGKITTVRATTIEVKEDSTGKYRYSVAAYTSRGKLYGLLADNETAGLTVGTYYEDYDIEVFETQFGSRLVSRIIGRAVREGLSEANTDRAHQRE